MAPPEQVPASLTREIGYGSEQTIDIWQDPPDRTEHAQELQMPGAVAVYEKMRRDAQVAAVMRQVTMPIRRTPFRIRPNGADDEGVERLAEDFGLPIEGEDPTDVPVQNRRRGRFSWPEHLRHALLMLTFGHSVFEQVYLVDADGWPRIRKLAWRPTITLQGPKVARDGGLTGWYQELHPEDMQQGRRPPGADDTFRVLLPVERLVVYVNDREGGNWYGQSLLRPAYPHWLLKHRLMRVEQMILERGAGVPIVEAPEGSTDQDILKLEALARRYRVGEGAGGALPHGAKLRLVGIEGTIPDCSGPINRHDMAIARNVLAQFMMLGGQDAAGHRALGEAFISTFYQALMAVVDEGIVAPTNLHVIEDWGDHALGPDAPVPLLVADDVAESHVVEAVTGLMQAGALTHDPELEDHLRRVLRLPRKTADAPVPEPPEPPEPDVPEPTPQNGPVGRTGSAQRRSGKRGVRAATGKGPEGRFRRDLFEHEQRASTDFIRMAARQEEAVDDALKAAKRARALQLQELEDALRPLVAAGDLAGLGDLPVPVAGMADDLADLLEELAEKALDDAHAEAVRQGATFDKPTLSPDMRARLAARAAATDRLLASSLRDTVGRAALRVAGGLLPVDAVVQSVRDHVEGLSDAYLRDQLGGAATAAENTGRTEVFRAGNVQRIFASEILDSATCDDCGDIDGKEYGTLAEAEADYPTGGFKDCQGRERCRGTIVVVYEEAAEREAA